MTEKMTLARPYAKAAFQHAVTLSQIENWSVMLNNAASMVGDQRVSSIISNPVFSQEKRAEFFTSQSNLFNDGFCNFIKLTASNSRLKLLPEIALSFDELKLSFNKEVDVSVTSANELDETQKNIVKDALEKKINKKLNVKFNIDGTLIGGILVRTGDIVIDGSIKGQLEKLMINLLN